MMGWKGNKYHPFNSRRGRLKGPIYIYIYIYISSSECPAQGQTLKDLKRSQGHQLACEKSGFGLLGPPDFTEIHLRG